jgi:predicted TIM-barrel fold metal-dependent hydrolase
MGYSRDFRTRRAFIAGAAGLAGGALTRPLLHAQPAGGLRVRPHRIDIHHHLFPPDYRTMIASSGVANQIPWTIEQSLAEMDRGGIQTSILSVSPPGVWLGDAMQSRKLARIINDYGAKMSHDSPGRYGLFAALPLPDIAGSLTEIEYAFTALKADGIGLMTNYGDRWLGDASFAPVWEELNRRKAVVYTHPNTPTCCRDIKDEVGPGTIEWATDTTRTAASLIFSGTAARYPDIRWILSHGGGTTPFLLGRFVRQEAEMKEREQRLPKGLMYELRKFYYDTAQANHPGALAALLKMAPVSQILYGTDYPFRTAGEESEGLSAQHFAPNDLRAIERDNALRILPRLKG